MKISRIGLGTVKFGRNQGVKYPEAFELPSDYTLQELLSYAQELGINVLDTAPAYGHSEERIGKLLKNNRHNWILSTKVGEEFIDGKSYFNFSPQAIRHSIERSLKRLNTDYLDIVLIHSNGEDIKIIQDLDVFNTLSYFKKIGLIRFFGMSTKTVEGGILAADQSDWVMVAYNPLYTEEKPVITHAAKKNKGIFIKKALASGHIEKIAHSDPIRESLHFIFAEKGITSVIIGTINKQHLKYNVDCTNSYFG